MRQVITEPGTRIKIKGIPAAIVDNHNESFYYWQDVRDACFLHVDGHKDLTDAVPAENELSSDYYLNLDITNFLCAAVHYNIISSLYWLNPHSYLRLLDFGCTEKKEDRQLLETTVVEDLVEWAQYLENILESRAIAGYVKEKMAVGKKQFILDVDLDAFSCLADVENAPKNHDAENGYDRRIQETAEFLKSYEKPSLITICRSQGIIDGEMWRYVNPDLVDTVQDMFIQSLEEIYK